MRLYATVYTHAHGGMRLYTQDIMTCHRRSPRPPPPPLTASAAAAARGRFAIGLRAMGATARRRRSSLAIGLSLSIQSATGQPLAFITFAIERSCSTSASVKNVTAWPARPARRAPDPMDVRCRCLREVVVDHE